MARLTALTAHSYGQNFYKKGETYETRTESDAAILVGIGKAERTTLPAATETDQFSKLVAEYKELTGSKPHHLWKLPRLKEELATAKAAKKSGE